MLQIIAPTYAVISNPTHLAKKKNILIVAQWACIQYNVQNVQDINKVGKPFGKKVQITKTVYNNIGGRYVV